MADKFTVELDLDNTKSNKKIKQLEKTAKRSGSKIGRRIAEGIRRAPLRALSVLRSRIFGIGTALIAVFGSRLILRAAARQEDAINNLNQALSSAGQLSKETSRDLQDFAIELQQISIISDELTLEMLALAQSFVKTSDEAKELTKVALDFSVGAGLSFEESLRRLGRGVQGASGDIANFAPQIRGLTRDQLAAGEATRILGERFAGAAAAQLETFSGITTATTNALGDMLENLGFIVTRSPAVIEVIKKLKKSFEDFSGSIASFNEADGFTRIIMSIVEFGRALVQFVVAPIELAVNVIKTLGSTFAALFAGVLNFMGQSTALIVKSFNFIRGEGFALGKDLKIFFDTLSSISESAFDDLAASQAATFDFGFADKLDQQLVGIKDFVTKANDSFKELDISNVTVAETLDNIKVSFTSFAGTALKISSTLVQGLAAQLVQGGKAFQSFGKTALNILGDFAIQLGEMIIASAVAIDALQKSLLTFGGAGLAIAAGLALILVGGALKSAAGGPAGLGSAGAAAVTPVAPAGDTTGQIPDIEQKQPVSVTVNVEGNLIRDDRETGEFIVDVLRNVLESNDLGTDINLVRT